MGVDDAAEPAARPFDLKLEGTGTSRMSWVTGPATNDEPQSPIFRLDSETP
jgi:hypothetical protein